MRILTRLSTRVLLVVALATAPLVWAQNAIFYSSTSGTWSLINVTETTCAVPGTSCVSTVPTTVANDGLVVHVFITGVNTTISSVTGDGSWSLCAASGCKLYNATIGGAMDSAYLAVATGGATSITVNVGSSATSMIVDVVQFRKRGGTATFDAVGIQNDTMACSSCTAAAITLTGSNDFISMASFGEQCNVSISPTPPWRFTGVNFTAIARNATVGTAPTVVTSMSGQIFFSGVAFK